MIDPLLFFLVCIRHRFVNIAPALLHPYYSKNPCFGTMLCRKEKSFGECGQKTEGDLVILDKRNGESWRIY